MNVDSILISEYATRKSGLLSVVNVFNTLESPSPPAQCPVMAVSMIIHGHSGEAGTTHEGRVELINEDREVIQGPNTFEWTFPPEEEMNPGMPLRHSYIWRLHNVSIPEPGPYAFEVYIDDIYYAAASLYVGFSQD